MASDAKKHDLQNLNRFDAHYHYAIRASIEQTKTILKKNYENPLSRKWATFLIGESGIGKNHLQDQVCKDLGIKMLWFPAKGIAQEDFKLPMISRTIGNKKYKQDLAGLVQVLTDYMRAEPDYKYKILQYLEPAFQEGWKGIIHFDEFLQAQPEVRQVIYMIYYDRRLDDRKLSDGAMIILSSNPPQQAQYQIYSPDHASMDRVMFLHVEGHSAEWINWAKEHSINDQVISFVEEHPGCYERNKGRRLEQLSNIVDSWGAVNPEEIPLEFRISIQGCIDLEHADMYIKYLKEVFDVSGYAVLKAEKKTMSRLKKMISSSEKAVHLHRIHSEMIKGIEDPEAHLGEFWTKLKKTDRWTILSKNVMKYCGLLIKNDMDSAVSLVRSLAKLNNPQLDKFLDVEFKKPENREFATEVLNCMQFQVQEEKSQEAT